MGMYDYICYHCPHCNYLIEDQSKAGGCSLSNYTMETAPPEVINSILGEHTCSECNEVFVIELIAKPTYRIRKG